MRTIYLRKDVPSATPNHRKILVDMAYLASHKMIRLPKRQFEDGLYLPIFHDHKDQSRIDKYLLTKDRIMKEDEYHYFFEFSFKPEQIENAAV